MVLLSPKFLAYVKKGITHGEKYYFHPFVWNKSRNEPELSESKRRLFLWYSNVLITLLYSLFLVLRSLQVNLEDGASNGKNIYMRFIIFFQSFPALFQLAIWLKKEEFPRFFLMSSQLFQQLDARNGNSDLEQDEEEEETQDGARSREFKMPKIFELFFDFVWYVFFLAGFGQGVVSFLRPHAADKISSVILNNNEAEQQNAATPVILTICVLFQLYYALMYCGNGFLWIFTGFSLFFPALVVLREIKNDLSPSRSGSGSRSLTKTKVNRILHTYKSMELLMKHFHQLFCTLVIPAGKLILMSLTVLCTYGAIKMHGFLAVFLAIIGLLAINILIAILASMAGLHTYSAEILFLMKSPQFQQHLDETGRKYVSALTLVKIKMGSSYYVDKKCVITVLQTVVDSTVDFLIANS